MLPIVMLVTLLSPVEPLRKETVPGEMSKAKLSALSDLHKRQGTYYSTACIITRSIIYKHFTSKITFKRFGILYLSNLHHIGRSTFDYISTHFVLQLTVNIANK